MSSNTEIGHNVPYVILTDVCGPKSLARYAKTVLGKGSYEKIIIGIFSALKFSSTLLCSIL